MYSIKDEQNGFRTPIVFGNDGDRKRAFILEAKNKDSLIHNCPQDFSIWAVGEWNTEKGIFTNYKQLQLIERAVNVCGDK
ncbi:nonstructural protein [Capybara microvirus Cap3_SP_389]|nr:nonstructural protein [Capybara microvirus Cap3_SP_389]